RDQGGSGHRGGLRMSWSLAKRFGHLARTTPLGDHHLVRCQPCLPMPSCPELGGPLVACLNIDVCGLELCTECVSVPFETRSIPRVHRVRSLTGLIGHHKLDFRRDSWSGWVPDCRYSSII